MTEADTAPPSPEIPGRPRSRWKEILVTLIVVGAIFAFAFPKLAGSGYDKIWAQLKTLTASEVLLLFTIWIVNLLTYTPVLVACLPGLTHMQALTLNLSGSAVSNTVPFGGALGIGTTYSMTRSWGFRTAPVTRSILISGIWNVFAKLGLPATALLFLAIHGRDNATLIGMATLGAVTLAVAVVIFALLLKTDRLARRIGTVASSLAHKVRPHAAPARWADRAVEFRHESASLIKQIWVRLSVWMIIYNLGQFAILLVAVRMFEPSVSRLGWTEVFAAFTLGRLLTTIPLTPSGVGFVETGLAGALRHFGGQSAACAAAVLVYSSFTYLLEIPAGAFGWATWAWTTRWRKPVPPASSSSPSTHP